MADKGAASGVAAMAAWLCGDAPAHPDLACRPPSPRALLAEARVGVEQWRANPATARLADALEQWLVEGGDLQRRLGWRVGRGLSAATLQSADREARQVQEAKRLLAGMGGDRSIAVRALALKLTEKHPETRVLREELGLAGVQRRALVLRQAASD